jgi:hypothetical protein
MEIGFRAGTASVPFNEYLATVLNAVGGHVTGTDRRAKKRKGWK